MHVKVRRSGGITCPSVTSQAAVACGNPATADAAATILRAGGNAVDAAIAAGFTAAVAEPGLTSLGGGGFLLLRLPGGEQHLLDFFVNAPGLGAAPRERDPHFTPISVVFSGTAQVFYAGYGSVGVPGVLDGYLAAHRRFGRLPLADVVAPAIQTAVDGTSVTATQGVVLGLLREILTLTPPAAEIFAPTGSVPEQGELLRNLPYADFLRALAHGDYSGWRDAPGHQELVDSVMSHDGLLTEQDLAEYSVIERSPLSIEYRGVTITTNPSPSYGGAIVCSALEALEPDGIVTLDADGTVRVVGALASATDAVKNDGQPRSATGTTHISVVDGEGGVASMTTSNGSCSGVIAPGTGVQLNNVMGEADLHPSGFHTTPPGTRIGSMMAPTLLDLPDGSVVALGSGGSERIRSALVQTIVRLVDGGQSLGDAITTARVHFDGKAVQAEPGVPNHTRAALAQYGPVNSWSAQDVYFGGVHAVAWSPDQGAHAAGDPRRDGAGLVIDL